MVFGDACRCLYNASDQDQEVHAFRHDAGTDPDRFGVLVLVKKALRRQGLQLLQE
jgi:hypothetical protein